MKVKPERLEYTKSLKKISKATGRRTSLGSKPSEGVDDHKDNFVKRCFLRNIAKSAAVFSFAWKKRLIREEACCEGKDRYRD